MKPFSLRIKNGVDAKLAVAQAAGGIDANIFAEWLAGFFDLAAKGLGIFMSAFAGLVRGIGANKKMSFVHIKVMVH
jgi:hypothetical protein